MHLATTQIITSIVTLNTLYYRYVPEKHHDQKELVKHSQSELMLSVQVN